jgi:deoxyribonuclease-4
MQNNKNQNRFFGCHVSASGGMENGIVNGATLGVNTIQIHASPPQRWNSTPSPQGYEDKFNELRKTSGIKKVFFHAIYLINLASSDARQRNLSKQSLLHALDLMHRINGDGVIVHVGSWKDYSHEKDGLMAATETLIELFEESKNNAPLLLEVAAGSGNVIGATLEQLATIAEGVEEDSRLGFALDTQHLWASGYDYANNLNDFISKCDQVLGLSRIKAIHLNDSKTPHASKKDRHENLGEGLIGAEALKGFFNHPQLANIPFILETPAMKSLETAAVEVAKLREWNN